MSGVSVSIASYICGDIVGLSGFYAAVFDLAEVTELRSDVFRGLDADGVTIGFSTPVVYEMLGIPDRAEPTGTSQYLTFEVASRAEVEERTAKAVELGATVVHDVYETYYGAYQAVLTDPAGNVFRINRFD